jgi:hypothetical protein
MFPVGLRSRLRLALLLVLSAAATAPAWIVRHPPLQDLPTHLAILRVVHSYSDPAFGFAQEFALHLFRTQYLLYYLLGSLCAYVVGVPIANVVLMCLYLGGTVLATRSLLLALGKDERLAVFTLPLLVNAMFMFGFLPFLLGIPMCLLGLAMAIRHVERPTRVTAVALGCTAFLLLITHMFPFGLFGIGFIAVFPWFRPRSWLRAGLPVAPALAGLVYWMVTNKTANAALSGLSHQVSSAAPYDYAIREAPTWSINVFRDTTDETCFLVAAFVAIAAVAMAQGDRDPSKRISRRYAAVPLVCLVLYFTTGEYIGEVWLFAQRFPVLALITGVPLLRMPTGLRGAFATLAASVAGLASIANCCVHFVEFERTEVGDFDAALDHMEPRKHVAGLIFDKGSSIVNLSPFLHFVSYYQVKKGGVIQFSNANIQYSPFHFRPDRVPPQGEPARPRWEWTPEAVGIQELYPYYDYVLTRGSGFRPPAGTFHLKWHGDQWTVWERG